MEQITLRIPEDTLEDLEREAEEHGSTRSEYIRDVLETRREFDSEHGEGKCVPDETHEQLQEEHAELKNEHGEGECIPIEEHDELQTEVERLRREKRQVLAQREENQQLQRYVEDELTWREQSLSTRLRWWIFGKEN
ncbi:ribbon-helix-helix protein, CopG family [Haladaptatus sp. NG-SE-30]